MGEGTVYTLLCVLCAVKLARHCSPAENTGMAVVSVFLAMTKCQEGNPQRGRVCFSLSLQRFPFVALSTWFLALRRPRGSWQRGNGKLRCPLHCGQKVENETSALQDTPVVTSCLHSAPPLRNPLVY